ncbi:MULTISPECIES: aromatic acid exporter family protein [unclassified Arthrobacter]|uniref:FUSC family protein n=1 Tax=unclassified Arthrobacter TaxID=235627 RepID=UPI001C841361|nr:FUSC family protein [Arthrobacter sp. MAHUQ-56]MBX7443687.1 FUSC family protein [Arthrobacter sp. MAHUQ-56]
MEGLSAAFAAQRLQLAGKAALAAGLAFMIAPLMPGAASHYAYYAPLGALVAMYHNVAGSVRQGLQTLAGLALGIGLAFILVSIADPSPLTVAIFMGIGVLLGGLPRIGSGSDWIPTAALLVLLVGGKNPDDFSFGYLVQMGAGVAVGVAVNFLIFPPLHLSAAASSLAELRLALGKQLTDMGAALKENWPPEHEEWSRRSDELAEAARSVRHLVKEADASRRANPRRKLHPRDVDQDYRHLRELERVTFHIQDMTDVLSDVIWKDDVPYAIPLEDSEPLADAISATGVLLSSYNDTDVDVPRDSFDAAKAAVEACMAATADRDAGQGTVPASESILLSLHRILRAVQPAT